MTDPTPTPQPDADHLSRLATLHEQPFTSDVPLIGGLIAWFRTAWNSVSTKWYTRPLVAQQTAFNQTVAGILEEQARAAAANEAVLHELDRRLLALDREQMQLSHDLGELSGRVIQLRRSLEALEAESQQREEAAD